jgi:hypothetical protein
VVRLAGPQAREIAMPMLRLRQELEPGRAVFGELVDPDIYGEDPTLSLKKRGTRVGQPHRCAWKIWSGG